MLLTSLLACEHDRGMDKPVHPEYGLALSGAPKTVDGVTFWPFKIGVLRYTRANADGSLEVRRHISSSVCEIRVNGRWLQDRRFRKFDTAARAAIKAMESKK